jgi:hypothetical protein
MLQELATNLSTNLAVASLLFFVAVYLVVLVDVFRRRTTDLDARARLALDDGSETATRDDRGGRR